MLMSLHVSIDLLIERWCGYVTETQVPPKYNDALTGASCRVISLVDLLVIVKLSGGLCCYMKYECCNNVRDVKTTAAQLC